MKQMLKIFREIPVKANTGYANGNKAGNKKLLNLLFVTAFISIIIHNESASGSPVIFTRPDSGQEIQSMVQNQQPASLRGRIAGSGNEGLQGASIVIPGTRRGVNANDNGEYYFENLREGKLSVRVSHLGYKTQTAEIALKQGQNELNFILEEEIILLDPVMVIAQKREKQILDVPAAISVVGEGYLERSNITELGQLSEYVPGLFISEQGANRPGFIIRGLTSDEVSPSAQPRVSVYFNSVPVNRSSGASVELFDMERVEVLKGPQNTLYGRGSQTGAIHFISKSPGNITEGTVTTGAGNYGFKELRGAVNVPVISNKLFIRAAGIYNFRDGYVENTFGGTLNGKNTRAGRLSLRYLPAENHKLDLIVNYQKDATPGIAFMSKMFPNTAGDTDIFTYRASLEQGENLRTGKDIFDATLTYKYNINEHTYWSSITSFRKINSSARWDGDGTAAPAIDMWEDAGADQLYQEIRYNFSLSNRLIGSSGGSYWHEQAFSNYWFSPNEQSMAVLFLSPSNLILPNGQPLIMPALPNDPMLGPLAGMPLPVNHQENNLSSATNQTAEAFADATYQLSDRLFLSGGLRFAYEKFKLSNEAAMTGGDPSTLGMMTGNYPNLFFKPGPVKSMDDGAVSLSWQTGLQFKPGENLNVFANYSNGRRPIVLQYTSAGTPEVIPAERIDNLDAGFKSSVAGKIYIDVVAFWQKYNNFQTRAWVADPGTGAFDYKTLDGGKATSYGLEATIKASPLKGLDLFGNYAYLNATFDEKNSDGSAQEYAGNVFRLSPKHSYTAGFHAKAGITSKVQAFLSPSYIYKTHIYFEDANTSGLEQEAYALLNLNMGIELDEPNLVLTFFGTNLFDKKFITSAGNTGSLFGVPTYVPGAPRMLGSKLSWRF